MYDDRSHTDIFSPLCFYAGGFSGLAVVWNYFHTCCICERCPLLICVFNSVSCMMIGFLEQKQLTLFVTRDSWGNSCLDSELLMWGMSEVFKIQFLCYQAQETGGSTKQYIIDLKTQRFRIYLSVKKCSLFSCLISVTIIWNI